jgi:hypothetical protein
MYEMCTRTLRSFIDDKGVLEKFGAWEVMGVDDWVAWVKDSILVDCLGDIFVEKRLQIYDLDDNTRLWKHSEVGKGESVMS